MEGDGIRVTVVVSMYRCARYLEAFFDAADKVTSDDVELLLLLNDPLPEEVSVVERRISGGRRYRYVPVVERETLYASWNRGIRLARGRFVTIWNVDDIRFPDALDRQADFLDDNPGVGMAYGDYYLSRVHGAAPYGICHELEYEGNERAAESRHVIGCFPMWRRNLHDVVGYFDEQFGIVGDFEFQLRCLAHCRIKKAPGILGVFYVGDMGSGRLSMSRDRSGAERTCVFRRYAQWARIDLMYLFQSFRFRSGMMKLDGGWMPVTGCGIGAWTRFFSRFAVVVGIAAFPYCLLRYVKNHIGWLAGRALLFRRQAYEKIDVHEEGEDHGR
ncbi:MAG: glycosyltransferase family 2 protein [Victivallaceae bacterium]|nr:glycosyltransferase family 2 protein [Victivallaceae bacterium]